jgi:hypothetical protein
VIVAVRTGLVFAAMIFATLQLISPAAASETITYTYDAIGRLVKVNHGTSGPNANITANYTYDNADNRCGVAVSTTGSAAATCAATGTTLTLSPATVPNGTVGTTYSQQITASGGTSPYTYSKTSGTLPPGLTLSSGGLLSGTPTTGGPYTFTVTATDSASHTGSVSYNPTISGGVTVTLSPTTVPNGTVGTSYSQQITASGGTSPYTYSKTSGTLPPGLTLSSAGLLSGTPTTAGGPYTFTVTATDSASHTGSRSYNPTISSSTVCNGVSFTIASNGAVTEGTTSSFTVTKTGSAGGSCAVNYATANGTAAAPGDYTAASGTLSFALQEAAKTVNVTTIDDAIVESSESFTMALSNPTNGATLGTPNSASATINDNDGGGGSTCSGVSFSVNDVTVVEGDPIVFTITKSGTTSSSCSVSYATSDGTATAPTYYTAVSGILTFGSSQATQTVTVNTVNLGRLNITKTMYLNLSNATGGGGISDTQGIGSIDPSGGDPNPCPLC